MKTKTYIGKRHKESSDLETYSQGQAASVRNQWEVHSSRARKITSSFLVCILMAGRRCAVGSSIAKSLLTDLLFHLSVLSFKCIWVGRLLVLTVCLSKLAKVILGMMLDYFRFLFLGISMSTLRLSSHEWVKILGAPYGKHLVWYSIWGELVVWRWRNHMWLHHCQ